MTARFIRHGDLMTVMEIIEDPVYLSEPDSSRRAFPEPRLGRRCRRLGPPCMPDLRGNGGGRSRTILPGKNPSIDELTTLYTFRGRRLGGAETMYPEYRKTMKDRFVRPDKCPANCGAAAAPPPPQAAPPPPPGR